MRFLRRSFLRRHDGCAVFQGLRERLNLLSPEDIREGIRAPGMTQREFGDQTGIVPETISRWLSGAIFSPAPNTLMQLFFQRECAKRLSMSP